MFFQISRRDDIFFSKRSLCDRIYKSLFNCISEELQQDLYLYIRLFNIHIMLFKLSNSKKLVQTATEFISLSTFLFYTDLISLYGY